MQVRSLKLSFFLLTISLAAWCVASMVEKNGAIAVIGSAAAFTGLLVVWFSSGKSDAYSLYAAAHLIRTVVALIAWYTSQNSGFEYWTGLNEDSNRYFLNSFLPWQAAAETTVDPGFPIMNSLLTDFASLLASANYLCNVQIPLVCGALFPVAVYAVVAEIGEYREARITGWLLAMNPISIGWSSGLMRDTVVAASSWLMFLGLLFLFVMKSSSALKGFILVLTGGAIAWSIRTTTFLAESLMFVVYFWTPRPNSRGNKTTGGLLISGIAIVGTIVLVMTNKDFINQLAGHLELGAFARSTANIGVDSIDKGGVSEMLANTGSTWPYFFMAPYAVTSPFPFFAIPKGANGELGRFVDYLFNLGGLVNQVCFGFYLCGLLFYWQEKRWGELLLTGPYFYTLCVFNTLSGGQTRWIMSVGYPLFLFAAATAWDRISRRSARLGIIWLLDISLVMLAYGAYVTIKAEVNVQIVISIYGIGMGGVVVLLLKNASDIKKEQERGENVSLALLKDAKRR